VRIVVDSCIFVSSFDPNDILHSECYSIFEKILNREIEALCPVIVLAETICVLRRKANSEDIALRVYKSLAFLPNIKWLDMGIDLVEKACLLGIKVGLKGGDAIVLQVAEQYSIPLLTKDKEIKEKSPKHILVFDPTELV
jgi:predicted nucleic acid-binding protein